MALSRHVIIAEDDAGIQAIIARVVVRTYPMVSVSALANGLDALLLYDQRGADLLITNHDMPGLSGLSLVEMLRVLRKATLPIIMVSADSSLQQRAFALGMNEFLVKPFTLEQLVQALTRLLPP
jgi:CheY-like chemotaxis protein